LHFELNYFELNRTGTVEQNKNENKKQTKLNFNYQTKLFQTKQFKSN